MPSRHRQHVDAVFAQAADLEGDDRAAFLDGLEDEVRVEVIAMLEADRAAVAFFEDAADRLADAASDLTSRPPERAGPWRPVRLLGRGGMGEVYLAERAQGDFEQRVALKVVQPGLAPDLVARFRTERRILAGLEHPGIARLLDGGVASDGRPYLAMELVEGEPITTYCDRHRLGIDDRLALFEDVCDAVAYAHSRLVVHRDLKPSNVFVADLEGGRRQVKLLDFGLARLLDLEADATRTDLHALTPEYAAPEQLRGEVPTTATDVYALGVLLYELLAGQRPFRLPSRLAAEAARVVLEERPTDPSALVRQTTSTSPLAVAEARATRPERLYRRLRGDLDRIAQVALRKEPARRYATADALARDVRRHLEGEPVEARSASMRYRMGRFVRRHRAGVMGAAAVLVLLVAYAATVTVQRAEIARERDRAQRFADLTRSLFDDANPYVDDTTAVTASTPLGEALYASARRLEADLEDEPGVRYDLLASLAGSLRGIGADSLTRLVRSRNRELAEAAFGRDDPHVLEAVGAEGFLLSETAKDSLDIARADSLLRRAVALSERVHGMNALEVGAALTALATHLKDHGDLEDAESAARRGVEIARRHDDADVTTALMIWSLALGKQGETDHAWSVAQEMTERALRERPEGSANLVSAFANAAVAAKAVGETSHAADLEGDALAFAQRHLGPNHATTLTVASNYSNTLWTLERYAEAERVQRRVLEARLERFGPEHPDTGISYQTLAGIVWEAGRIEDAAALYRQASAAFDAALPTSTPTRAFPYLSLTNLESDRERYLEAERLARTAVVLARESVGADHPMAADATARVGRALVGQGRVAEGRRALDAALVVLRPALGDDHKRVLEAVRWRTDPTWRAE